MIESAPAQYQGPQRVFSGMQPTNGLHLGNYLGALQKFVALQDSFDCIYCIVDLHAITAGPDPKELAARSREVAAAYLAAGVDPKRSIIFIQSAVREHSELAWIFNCVARMGWLERMTQFKDKAGQHAERMSVGLFDYPVLQAARYPSLQGNARAGRRGSETTPGTVARHRPEVQQRLRRARLLPLA